MNARLNQAMPPTEQPADTPQVLLEHYLKVLRLPSFSRDYDKVAGQCAQEGIDHPRYCLLYTSPSPRDS